MSYCRWSTDDFQCDLYCYEDCNGGWTTHVAGNRVVYKEPLPPVIPFPRANLWTRIVWKLFPPKIAARSRFVRWLASFGINTKPYFERHQKVMDMLDDVDRVSIELPHAGETFNDATLEDFLATLEHLRGIGYLFPDDVIEAVKEELAEQK